MKQFLVFGTEQQAIAANDLITTKMAPTFDHNTTQWAEPLLRLDGLYCFAKPADEYMVGVEYLAIEEFTKTWFDPQSANIE